VKIERIQVDAFGKLQDWSTGPRPLGSLVVVLGPNEAGKSTLFSFLTTALYGFHPASRELNPHVPWGAEEAGGCVSLRLDAQQRWSGGGDARSADLFPGELELGLDLGPCVTVERRLRTSPSAKLSRGDVVEELRNHPLPWVEHVPRAVFGQVFAITLADLAGLDDETWGRIQDRVLGSMGASDLRSARDVADALEKEAGEIWRPSRRGNQRLREVQEEIRALRSGRNEALDRDRDIRARVAERESVEQRLREVREQRQRDKLVVERMQELLPIKRQLDLVAALRRKGGPCVPLAGLPDDPKAEVARRTDEAAALRVEIADLDRDIREPTGIVERYDDSARHLVGHRDRIAQFLSGASMAPGSRARLEEARHTLEALELRVRTAGEQVLDRSCDEAVSEAIAALSVDLLGDRVDRLARLERARAGAGGDERDGSGATDAAADTADGRGRTIAAVLVALGAVALIWRALGGPAYAAIAGAALVAAGVTRWAMRRPSARDARPTSEPETDQGDALRAEITDMLIGVPVRTEYVDPPGAPLVSGLDGLRKLVVERREALRDVESLEKRMAEADSGARVLARELGRAGEIGAEALANTLGRELREAERARDAADGAGRERERLLRQRRALVERAEAAEADLSALLGRIEVAAGGGERDSSAEVEAMEQHRETAGDPAERQRALDDVQRRVEEHTRADRIEEELERSHPDLDEIRSRIEAGDRDGISWTVDEDDLAARKVRIEDFDTSVEDLIARSKQLESEVAHLREMETVDAVDSAIATLQETEARLVRERDRKWVLAQLVRDADRRFREDHQPDLIRRASAYLERLTGGRYDRLLVDEYGEGDLFQLVGPGLPAPVPLDRPISTATLEQAYLSLRLAIVDHLDQGKERLPLFLDEAFVNWDAERRDHGLEALAEISSSRQVFAFTCHPEMAERLGAMGAHVLRLER
jgi:uncharacterized protein YhaN